MTRIMVVFGTRPEAIKLFPVIRALQRQAGITVRTCATGQHRGLLDQVLDVAELVPDIDLDLMEPGQSLDRLTARLLTGLGAVLDRERPDRVLVQGDTTTAFAAALAAFYRRIPVGHVEAGLRTGDLDQPWPEEGNRRMIAPIIDLHFAPTATAAAALHRESVVAGVHVTGNTVIDALYWTRDRLMAKPALTAALDPVIARCGGRRVILVTAHRRENAGAGLAGIAAAVMRLAARGDVAILWPTHPNPAVTTALTAVDHPAVIRIAPLDYPSFVRALARCHLVLTDSGGVQEEAPAFGKPVLVMRDTTERPEAVAAGTAMLVGTEPDRIVAATTRLLDDEVAYAAMARAHHPFGDGRAATRIAAIVGAAHHG
ncbi:UDP-N-acetylglucosamine 2-epimerase (non-hydrolyzing) [Sphingomonas cynarae]|uniref:UDP-N-acetylglucosamine 2-epimerase (non-hydrolyzing) n=1 Tax=Sphingomonas cynarae TaxID=930197 RepID=A0ABP7EJE2_9SPHN